MGLATFIGGVHPYEGKELSENKPVQVLEPKGNLVYPMSQHIGAPAKPLVSAGDRVLAGQKIGEAVGFISANVIASVSGVVKAIEPRRVAGGGMSLSVIVENDGQYETVEGVGQERNPESLSKDEIRSIVKEAGIVGMGGAGFPTHVKLAPPPPLKAECLVVNAVECEPYLTADHQLMLEHADEILAGVSVLMKAIRVQKAFIGIEANKPDAIRLLSEGASACPGVEVVPLKVKYPQGGEKQLIEAVIGRRVAAGALPVSTGAIVQNVATVFAVYQAVQKNKPLLERVVTVTGHSLARPGNLLARIGTPVSQLVEECGGLPDGTGKVIGGGPMMGKALLSLDVPVAKGTSGVLLMDRQEAVRGAVQPCIRCAKCVAVCPMGLEPYLLATVSAHGGFERVEQEGILSCIECGSCQFTCPSHRPILDYVRLGKSKVAAMARARQKQ